MSLEVTTADEWQSSEKVWQNIIVLWIIKIKESLKSWSQSVVIGVFIYFFKFIFFYFYSKCLPKIKLLAGFLSCKTGYLLTWLVNERIFYFSLKRDAEHYSPSTPPPALHPGGKAYFCTLSRACRARVLSIFITSFLFWHAKTRKRKRQHNDFLT